MYSTAPDPDQARRRLAAPVARRQPPTQYWGRLPAARRLRRGGIPRGLAERMVMRGCWCLRGQPLPGSPPRPADPPGRGWPGANAAPDVMPSSVYTLRRCRSIVRADRYGTTLVSRPSSPPGPVRLTPSARARSASCRTSSSSAASARPSPPCRSPAILRAGDQGPGQGMARARRARPIRDRKSVPTSPQSRDEGRCPGTSGRRWPARPSVLVSQPRERERSYVQRN